MDYMTKPLQFRNRCSNSEIGAQHSRICRYAGAKLYFIGKNCWIPEASGRTDGTTFPLFSTALAVRSVAYP